MKTKAFYTDLTNLLQAYSFEPFPTYGNEAATFVADRIATGPVACKLAIYPGWSCDDPGWMGVTLAFGEVRHIWGNRTHMARDGLAYASWSYKEKYDPNDICGSALPGNELEGSKWRIGAVYPKSRTSVGVDRYVQVCEPNTIVSILLLFRDEVHGGSGHPEDFSHGAWDGAEVGW